MVGRTQCVLPTLALLSSGISISLPRTHSTFSFNKLPQLKHIWSSLLFICFKCLHELQFKNKHLINSPGFCLSRESQAITQSYNVLGVNYFSPRECWLQTILLIHCTCDSPVQVLWFCIRFALSLLKTRDVIWSTVWAYSGKELWVQVLSLEEQSVEGMRRRQIES